MDILRSEIGNRINTNSKLVKNTVSSLIERSYELLNKKIAEADQTAKGNRNRKAAVKQLKPLPNRVQHKSSR
jgi:hypothetical protein